MPTDTISITCATQKSSGNIVWLVPDLSAAALKSHQDKELMLWYLMRAFDTKGCGDIDYQDFIDWLVTKLDYHHKTLHRHLDSGMGKLYSMGFLKSGRTRIKIWGLFKVTKYFGIDYLTDKHKKGISVDNLKTLRARRSVLYSSIHKPHGVIANPRSRANIQQCTGVLPRQQRRYESKSYTGIPGVRRTVNISPSMPQDKKRLPNSYHSHQVAGARGMLPKVNKALRKESCKHGEAFIKRYFTSVKKLLRARAKDEVSYTLIRNNKRQIRGRLEWAPVLTMV